MRAMWLLLAACSPDIASGAYLCGAEQDCPDGLVCDGVTASCVTANLAQPFTCAATDTSQATATAISPITCAVNGFEDKSCVPAKGEVWYTVPTTSNCNVPIDARIEVASAYAFAPLTVELRDATGATVIATATAGCKGVDPPESTGEYAYCLTQTLAAGTTYTLRVAPTGDANCGGDCSYNTYRLDITPSP